MATSLDRLAASVAAQPAVDDSVVALLTDLSARLRAAANDPAAITALADALDAEQAKLAAAVVANTPAAE